LLYLDGYELRAVPLIERKGALEQLLGSESGIIRYSSHFEENGELVLRHACRLSLEGIVSKLRDAPYRSGRGKSWVKSKCSARQEFVVAVMSRRPLRARQLALWYSVCMKGMRCATPGV
jgi:bifunctional non-homologous end joining protein LigD